MRAHIVPKADPKASSSIERIIHKAVGTYSVGGDECEGREEVAVAQRALLNVVRVHTALLAIQAVEEP